MSKLTKDELADLRTAKIGASPEVEGLIKIIERLADQHVPVMVCRDMRIWQSEGIIIVSGDGDDGDLQLVVRNEEVIHVTTKEDTDELSVVIVDIETESTR